MTWLQRYRVRHYFANAVWIWPLLSMVAALGAFHALHAVEEGLGWQSSIHPATAQVVLGTMASAMFTFIVFVCSALLVAVQLASAQLTPRIIALVFKDRVIKIALAVFTFTFTFTLTALLRVGTAVPLLTSHLAAYCFLASLALFLYMIDHVGKALRPSGALWTVGRLGRAVIAAVYPRRLEEAPAGPHPKDDLQPDPRPRTIPNLKSGVVLAFDVPGLADLARRQDCVVELVPQVGNFVAQGDPLFRILKGGPGPADWELRQAVAVDQERTVQQDPAFVFRILVDIASKGLSPAINDPTTAVLSLDQIHHLLRDLGGRRLEDEGVRDREGRLRLVYRTPDWEDFVRLAITEIRHFGGSSVQVARRLRALLEDLIETLPEERLPPLRRELKLLHRAADRFFADPEERALAEVSDSQGVGGKPQERRADGREASSHDG
jgi:uncharacterized membrane protein